ncbi:hypothetical protein [Janthinobacterium psychrotolerans]|uniref:Uncharacterized protein n=1 Tax=Janthinobacterium psychrotolerans TaxID=1747903 RepID=A0A1A7BY10_9BURK|nr:hypothetical protein [Janthinobacterium psychrotolerans]OBV38402.1 hypothetical protein ASR47_1005360 [Janthinobacterium psychrotolerans]
MEQLIKRKKLGLTKSSLRELTAAEMTYVAGGEEEVDTGDGGGSGGSGSDGGGDGGGDMGGGAGIFESAVCTTSCNSCFGCGAPAPTNTCPAPASNTCPNPGSYTCPGR